MLTEIRVPKLGDSPGWAYLKSNRRAQDWATVGVAALVHRDERQVAGASIGLVNMGGTPLRARAAEDALVGGSSVADAAALARRGNGAADRPGRISGVPCPPGHGAGASRARAGDGDVAADR